MAPLSEASLKKRPIPPKKKVETELSQGRLFLQNSFGLSRWEGWGFSSGLGIGVFPPIENKMGWALEGRITLVSKGSLFTILGGVWYYLTPPLLSQQFISFGLLLGAGFPGREVQLNKTTAVGLLELANNYRLNEYAWFKIWSRGGLIGKEATAQLGFSLLFQLK